MRVTHTRGHTGAYRYKTKPSFSSSPSRGEETFRFHFDEQPKAMKRLLEKKNDDQIGVKLS